MAQQLLWDNKYSVGVKEIDDQHKQLFTIINELIGLVGSSGDLVQINKIIGDIINYKKSHFATEEKYFDLFEYEGSEEHKAEHKKFNEKIEEISKLQKDDVRQLSFTLVDYLEDWLVDHLMNTDQKYVKCFHDHGLK